MRNLILFLVSEQLMGPTEKKSVPKVGVVLAERQLLKKRGTWIN